MKDYIVKDSDTAMLCMILKVLEEQPDLTVIGVADALVSRWIKRNQIGLKEKIILSSPSGRAKFLNTVGMWLSDMREADYVSKHKDCYRLTKDGVKYASIIEERRS